MQLLLFTITKYSYCAIFIALGLGILGLPIPDETLMAYAGFLAFQGKMNYLLTIMAAFLGTSCGVTIGYSLGRTFGNPFIKKYADRMHVHPNDIREAEKFYNKYGRFALFIGYFIPGIRHLTAIFAGTSLMPYGTFALFAYTGGFYSGEHRLFTGREVAICLYVLAPLHYLFDYIISYRPINWYLLEKGENEKEYRRQVRKSLPPGKEDFSCEGER
jgi:membrane protein DedA with SNARE-associated domain